MALSGTVTEATHNELGFDSNGVEDDGKTPNRLTAARVKAFAAANYAFCLRYLSRNEENFHKFDLSADEAEMILDAGLGLMAVQHVPPEWWHPDADLGLAQGRFAVHHARDLVGLPEGVTVFLDLEGVAAGTAKEDVLEYCLAWRKVVADAGYSPGLYTGDAMRINGKDVGSLDFNHYWLAFTENFSIPGRAFQMHQFTKKFLQTHPQFRPKGVGAFKFQVDTTMAESGHGSLMYLKR